MKTGNMILKTIICLLILAVFPAAFASSPRKVTLMSYNIRNGVGMDNVRDIDRTAAVIAAVAPDAVAVEEVDSVTGRSGGAYVLGLLAEKLGMHATYAPAIDFDGGRYGIGMLSRREPLTVKRLQLPGREEQRTILICEFEDYVYCATHLSLTEADRDASLKIILEAVKDAGKPVFLAGDFNSAPDEPFMLNFRQSFTVLSDITAATFPADNPVDIIDYITELKRPGVKGAKVLSAEVVDAPTQSDHRPIVVKLVLPAR